MSGFWGSSGATLSFPFRGGAAAATDPNWSDVVFLLSSRNGSIEDLSGNVTITVNGVVTVSSAQAKFGTTSIAMGPSGDYLACAQDDAISLTGALTIEAWVWGISQSKANMGWFGPPASAATNGALQIIRQSSDGKFSAYLYETGFHQMALSNGSVSFGAWHHVAFCRDAGNNGLLFIDGVKQTTGAAQSGTLLNDFVIGRGNTAVDHCSWYGYVDEVRVTKNVARYTANFSVPTARFPAS